MRRRTGDSSRSSLRALAGKQLQTLNYGADTFRAVWLEPETSGREMCHSRENNSQRSEQGVPFRPVVRFLYLRGSIPSPNADYLVRGAVRPLVGRDVATEVRIITRTNPQWQATLGVEHMKAFPVFSSIL